jgi:hypothetical protein
MRTVKIIATSVIIAALAALLTGCAGGDLASLNKGGTGEFRDTSSAFTVAAGDTINVTYACIPGDGDRWMAITLDSASGADTQSVVMTSGNEANGQTFAVQQGGEYVITAWGHNYAYDVSVSKE